MTQHVATGENARLADETEMGTVTLKVADLDNMIKYYTQALPLQVLAQVVEVALPTVQIDPQRSVVGHLGALLDQ